MMKDSLRQYGWYQRLAKLWWAMQDDWRTTTFVLLAALPGKSGIYLRQRLLVRRFDACGALPVIMPGLKVDNPGKLKIGNPFLCNHDVYISADGQVEIGHDVSLGPSVKTWSINHRYERLDIPIAQQGWHQKKVIIEDDVWVGAGAIILPGVRIGRGSVIGAGTVLTRSVPSLSVVVGNTGRVIKHRTPEAQA